MDLLFFNEKYEFTPIRYSSNKPINIGYINSYFRLSPTHAYTY